MNESTARNMRVQNRYDELMGIGKHGHYETMFRVVREEIESLRQQLADNALHGMNREAWVIQLEEKLESRDAEVARLKGMVDEIQAARKVNSAHDKLLVQLAKRDKQVTLLRDALTYSDDLLTTRYGYVSLLNHEALAATADLDGLILCEKKPAVETLSVVTNTGYVYVRAIDRKVEPNTKLFSAWEPK